MITTPAIHEALAWLLDYLPPALHLVILTRADPPLPLARLRANGTVTELHADDLRFTPDEVAAFLNEVMGLALSGADLAALEARTEGWIAGLQLAALALRDTRPPGFIRSFHRQQPLYRGLPGRRGVRAPAGPHADLLAPYRHPRPHVRPAV